MQKKQKKQWAMDYSPPLVNEHWVDAALVSCNKTDKSSPFAMA